MELLSNIIIVPFSVKILELFVTSKSASDGGAKGIGMD
jgi:hypothetical protein